MKLVLDKKHGNRLEVIGKDVDQTLLNMLRRYGMSRVHVMAIENVTFYDNSSGFWDEYIAHRLGLFPIITPDKTPAGAEVLFSIDAEGPKTVYASDLTSSDKEIVVAKGNIPIVTLGPNQHMRFEAKAVLGIAKKHAKFQAGLISYGKEGDDLRIFVESFFQMEPAEVIERAIDIVESDVERIEEALGQKPAKKKSKKSKKEEE